MNMKIVAAALAAAALMPATANAQGSESVSSGVVAATLSWSGSDPISGAKLTITRNGAATFDQTIPDVVCDGCVLNGSDDVRVVDLDGDGEGEVMVTSYTGGQHCCTLLGVYDFRPALGTYAELGFNLWANGFTLDDLEGDGVPEFNAVDERFNDLFTSHAGSFPPAAVFRYARPTGVARLYDATRDFPQVIRRNAAEAKKRFARLKPGEFEAEGFVAAYVADQYLLGRGSTGLRELDKQIRRGILGRPRQARAFRARLLKVLRRYGYR